LISLREPRHRRTLTAALASLCLALCTAGCVPAAGGPGDTFGLDFSLPADAARSGTVIFIVDGLSAEVFEKLLDAGELPAIKRYFVDRGLYVRRAAASTPSVTLPNLTSIVSGKYPGHHGIAGINWFDRNQLIWRNYETIAQKNKLDHDHLTPLLYHYFPNETTVSVFFQPHRDATKFIENWTSAGPPFFFGWYEFVDRLTLYRMNVVIDIARARRAWPAVTTVYLLAPDFRGYGHGAESRQYADAIRHTDRQIGRVLGDMERAGLLDGLRLALVSDHGMMPVTRQVNIEKAIERELSLRVARRRLWERTPFEDRLEYYQKVDVVTYGSGDRYLAVCLRKPAAGGAAPWPDRPTEAHLLAYPTANGPANLPAVLLGCEGVDTVTYAPGPGAVRVCRRSGQVEFRQQAQGEPISYHRILGSDPLGIESRLSPAAAAGEPMTVAQWFAATAPTEFPDLPAQILAYFRSRRAGDLALFASPGYDFRGIHAGGHGGLSPHDMFTPMLIAGPGVPHSRLDYARTVDLVPTILQLMGKNVPPDLDGAPLVRPN
jgi:arylsulfatase A-like enzyme